LSSDEDHLKTLTSVNHKVNHRQSLRVYQTDLNVFDDSTESAPLLIALNGGKGWYKEFRGDFNEKNVAEWVDAVKMGEGKKLKLPENARMFGDDTKTASDEASTTDKTSASTSSQQTSTAGEFTKEDSGDEKESVHDEL
jgi:hypothetical protein